MDSVSVRDLRNNGADVIARVRAGETLTVTRDGEPVALLSPLPRAPLGKDALIERHRNLPPMDHAALRRDLDAVVDQSL